MHQVLEEGAPQTSCRTAREPLERARGDQSGAREVRLTPAPSPLVCLLVGFDQDGRPLVEIASQPGELLPARSTVRLPKLCGSEVLVLLEGGDRQRPIIIGVLQSELAEEREEGNSVKVSVDGKALELVAQRELVLRCGDASITLTAAGKVLIRGRYVVSRSSGANKIKGAVVDIN